MALEVKPVRSAWLCPFPARIKALISTAFSALDVTDFMLHHMACDLVWDD